MEVVHSFEDGEQDALEYEIIEENGSFYLRLNDGELGRVEISSAHTVEELRRGLDRVESRLKEMKRRSEEL